MVIYCGGGFNVSGYSRHFQVLMICDWIYMHGNILL